MNNQVFVSVHNRNFGYYAENGNAPTSVAVPDVHEVFPTEASGSLEIGNRKDTAVHFPADVSGGSPLPDTGAIQIRRRFTAPARFGSRWRARGRRSIQGLSPSWNRQCEEN